ncbi:hypothetical protein NDU88_001097 [Pleurodeles waltl]|uniref:Uncharacterized protein n=1 Tax=Pleurodeles waltl TaxID=8319 RepID=A0AAV7KXI7_PLEWA|nr:hypothetical protein NDU88_001097 [Pleurodeles waltl]
MRQTLSGRRAAASGSGSQAAFTCSCKLPSGRHRTCVNRAHLNEGSCSRPRRKPANQQRRAALSRLEGYPTRARCLAASVCHAPIMQPHVLRAVISCEAAHVSSADIRGWGQIAKLLRNDPLPLHQARKHASEAGESAHDLERGCLAYLRRSPNPPLQLGCNCGGKRVWHRTKTEFCGSFPLVREEQLLYQY